MADLDEFDPSRFGGTINQAAPTVPSASSDDFDPSLFGGGGTVNQEADPTATVDDFDPSQFGGTTDTSQYKNMATEPKVYTNSVREDLLSRWQTTYSKMPEGPERERYGKLLATAWDAHVDMQRYNDPLLFRAADTGVVTGGVGVMKGGLAGGEILLSLPGVNAIPGAEGARQSLKGVRENLQAKQNLFEQKEEAFDKESAIGETAAGLTRDMSGFATQLLMAYSIPGAGATAGTLPVVKHTVSVGEVALATMLGSEAAATSLSRHPDAHGTALLHGVVNAGGALFLGKSGDLAAKFGKKVTPRAIQAVSNKLLLTPVMDVLAHASGAGAEQAATGVADYMMDVALTQDEYDPKELVNRIKQNFIAGAGLGGGMRIGGKLAKAFSDMEATLVQRHAEAPLAAQAIADAREMFRKNADEIEEGISAKFREGESTVPEGYKEYFDGELNALQSLEAEYRANVKSTALEAEQIKTRREEVQAKLDELDILDREVKDYVIGETGNRIVGQSGRGDVMVEGTEGAVRDLSRMRETLLAELKGLDERQFAVIRRQNKLDREGKSVKDFVESEFDRLSSDEALLTNQSLDERFTKDLDDAVALENEIASGGRTVPQEPIPGQESANVPDKATDVELIDRLGHFTIGGRQRDMQKMRTFFDLDKLTKQESQGFEETMIKAQQRGLIDTAPDVAMDVLTKERLLDSEEFAGVVERARQNHDKYVDLMKQRSEATSKERRSDIDLQMKGLEQQQNILTEAAYHNNSAVGRRLNLAKLRLQEAYDPMALLSRADRALASRAGKTSGRDLSDVERDDLLGIAKRISDEGAKKRANPDVNSPEFRDADYKEFLARVEADQFIEKLRPKTFVRKVGENLGLGLQDVMKSTTLSMDASLLTLHGGVPAMVAPTSVKGALAGYVRALRDPSEVIASNRRLFEGRANSDLYAKYDNGMTDITQPLSKQDYIFLREYSGQIPGLARIQGASTVALNTLRADLFDIMVAARGGRDTATHEGLKAIASYVRTATGRGGLGPFENSARALSGVFLSPRWFVSRFQHLFNAPVNMYRAIAARDYGTARVLGKAYAQQYAMTAAAGYIAGGIASMMYPGQVSYSANPFDPDFGLLKVRNNRYDLTAGMRKPVVLVSAIGRAGLGVDKPMDATQRVGSLVTGAMGPYGRLANEFISREEMGTGEKIDFSNPSHVAWFISHGFVPLPAQSFVRGLTDSGMSVETAQQTAAAVMGIPSWKQRSKKKR